MPMAMVWVPMCHPSASKAMELKAYPPKISTTITVKLMDRTRMLLFMLDAVLIIGLLLYLI
jgi:hypothetical protein